MDIDRIGRGMNPERESEYDHQIPSQASGKFNEELFTVIQSNPEEIEHHVIS